MAFRAIVIGASWGGGQALQTLLTGLPKGFPAPVIVVLHRAKDTGGLLASVLQRSTPLPVVEVEDKLQIAPACVYLAPADYHLIVEHDHFALSMEGPVAYARPSIDVLFESAAEAYGQELIGVILTGAGRDGARGMAQIKEHGGLTVVQTPATAEVSDMPNAALGACAVDFALSLEGIARFLVERVAAPRQTRG